MFCKLIALSKLLYLPRLKNYTIRFIANIMLHSYFITYRNKGRSFHLKVSCEIIVLNSIATQHILSKKSKHFVWVGGGGGGVGGLDNSLSQNFFVTA